MATCEKTINTAPTAISERIFMALVFTIFQERVPKNLTDAVPVEQKILDYKNSQRTRSCTNKAWRAWLRSRDLKQMVRTTPPKNRFGQTVAQDCCRCCQAVSVNLTIFELKLEPSLKAEMPRTRKLRLPFVGPKRVNRDRKPRPGHYL